MFLGLAQLTRRYAHACVRAFDRKARGFRRCLTQSRRLFDDFFKLVVVIVIIIMVVMAVEVVMVVLVMAIMVV